MVVLRTWLDCLVSYACYVALPHLNWSILNGITRSMMDKILSERLTTLSAFLN